MALCAGAAYAKEPSLQRFASLCMLPSLAAFATDQLYQSFVHMPAEINWWGYFGAVTAGTTVQLLWCAVNAFDLVGPPATAAAASKKRH
jgi:hypothetical protein